MPKKDLRYITIIKFIGGLFKEVMGTMLANPISVDGRETKIKKGDVIMNFGQAIEELKNGKRVSRTGWNGKGMFLYMTKGSICYLDELKQETANYLRCFYDKGMDEVEICPHIDMKTSDNKLVIGWLASQTDMLAEDWYIVG